MIVNAILLVGLTTIVYRLLVKISGVRTAVIVGATFLVVFAFSHALRSATRYVQPRATFSHALRIGNYNYICPYSHEMPHGITLIFCMLMLGTSRCSANRVCQLILGVLWGWVFLGKAESRCGFGCHGMSERSFQFQHQISRRAAADVEMTKVKLADCQPSNEV